MGLAFINTYAVRGRTKELRRVLGYLRGRAGAQLRKNIGVEVCRTAETSKAQSDTTNTSSKSVTIKAIEALNIPQRPSTQSSEKQKSSTASSKTLRNCNYCGKQHEPCEYPAYSKECSFCHKVNHFATVCQSRLLSKQFSTLARHVRDI